MAPDDDTTRNSGRSILKKVAGSRTWMMILAPLAVSILVFFLALVHLLNLIKLEDQVQSYSTDYMRDFTNPAKFNNRVKIILIPEKQQSGDAPWGDSDKKHREFFAQLIRAMTVARAKVIAFDVAFKDPTNFDKEFSDAVTEAEKQNLKVIVGVEEYSSETGTFPKIPFNIQQPRWGMLVVGGSQEEGGALGTMKVAEFNAKGDSAENPKVVPSLALRSVIEAHDPPLEAEYDEGRLNMLLYAMPSRTLVKSIPLERQNDLLLDNVPQPELDRARVLAKEAYDQFPNMAGIRDYENAIVLVGYEMGEAQKILTGGTRLGVELHATAVSNILNETFIKKLPPLQNYLLILFMALLGAALHIRITKGSTSQTPYTIPFTIPFVKIPVQLPLGVAILSALYIIAAFIIYKFTRAYLDVCYHIAALWLSYGLLWFVLNKWSPKQEEYEHPTVN